MKASVALQNRYHLAISFVEEVLKSMERLKMNKADLARKLNVSPPYISKLMHCEDNLTIQQMCRIADAVGLTIHMKVKRKKP